MSELTSDRARSVRKELLPLGILWIAVALLYWNPNQPGKVALAMDYEQLHARRMDFAREAILGASHTLPAWYPREMLGTPFRGNLQNFPLIPTRLLITLSMDPNGTYAYTAAVTLAAILASSFTFLFSRRVGIGLVGSMAAGWTFAGSGYFASRVGAGHLPLLEVYCALPLVLWCVESLIQACDAANRSSVPLRFIALLLATSCLLLGGHPQIPIYAIVASAVYAIVRGGMHRAGGLALLAIFLGGLCVSFSLLPMAMLIGRSTRVLLLDPAANDLVLPWKGLLGFFVPWPFGTPSPTPRDPMNGLRGTALFWDTFCYIGILPWIALALLGIKSLRMRGHAILPRRVMGFILILGLTGALLALPPARQLFGALPGTLLRSPARLIYLTEFSLAIALGAAAQLVLTHELFRPVRWLIPAALALHAFDLGTTSQRFSVQLPVESEARSKLAADAAQSVGDFRVAIDQRLAVPINRRVDDVGAFDSILLARPYRWLFRMSGFSANVNRQNFDGSELSPAALRAAGVKTIVTLRQRDDLPLLRSESGVRIYQVEAPAPRAGFIAQGTGAESIKAVEYQRSSSDEIHCAVSSESPGLLRVIEAWDPGWTATVDGKSVAVDTFDETLLAVRVDAGTHDVRFRYHTPGAHAGIALSMLGVIFSGIGAVLIHRRESRRIPALMAAPG